MKIDYSKYEVEDLLKDDFFIKSIQSPTENTEFFWAKELENNSHLRKVFDEAKVLIQSIYAEKQYMTKEELAELWDAIENKNKRFDKSKKLKRVFYPIAAACAAVLIMLPFFKNSSIEVEVNNDQVFLYLEYASVTREIKEVSLVTPNNDTILIEGKSQEILQSEDGSVSVNNKLVVENNDGRSNHIQLLVPFGKKAHLILSDGTKIWANSGTSVIYPNKFTGKERNIYVDGEIFVDAAKDKNRPFIVNAKDINVEVLGTSFNVNAYKNSKEQEVVLVEGLVKIKTSREEDLVLYPKELFVQDGEFQSVKEVDVAYYLLWRDGIYQFDKERLENVLERVSQYYGETIICKGSSTHLTGKLDMTRDLTKVLDGLSKAVGLKWKKENNMYILSK